MTCIGHFDLVRGHGRRRVVQPDQVVAELGDAVVLFGDQKHQRHVQRGDHHAGCEWVLHRCAECGRCRHARVELRDATCGHRTEAVTEHADVTEISERADRRATGRDLIERGADIRGASFELLGIEVGLGAGKVFPQRIAEMFDGHDDEAVAREPDRGGRIREPRARVAMRDQHERKGPRDRGRVECDGQGVTGAAWQRRCEQLRVLPSDRLYLEHLDRRVARSDRTREPRLCDEVAAARRIVHHEPRRTDAVDPGCFDGAIGRHRGVATRNYDREEDEGNPGHHFESRVASIAVNTISSCGHFAAAGSSILPTTDPALPSRHAIRTRRASRA